MELYQKNISRANRTYLAALSPRRGVSGGRIGARRGGSHVAEVWQPATGKGRAAVPLRELKENRIKFTASGETGSKLQEGWYARQLSASFERDARRYEKWL